MDLIPRFRRFFFGQDLNSVGIPFLLGTLLLVMLSPLFAALVICLLGVILLLFLLFPWKSNERKRFLLAALGLALSLLLGGVEAAKQGKLQALEGEVNLCRGVVTAVSDTYFDLHTSSPIRGKIRVTGEEIPSVGKNVELKAELSSKVSSAQRMAGVDLVAEPKEAWTAVGSNGWYTWLGSLRERVAESFGDAREGGFLRAVLVGDRSALSAVDRNSFQKTSSSHLLAISGLHVSQMLGLLFAFLNLFPVKRRFRSVLMIPPILFLLFFTGGSVSVFRAALMAIFPVIGNLFFRRSDSVTALVCAAVLLVIWEPTAICSPSFLLSFFSTLGILVAAAPLCGWLSLRIWERGRGVAVWLKKAMLAILASFAVSSASFVFTFPIQLFLFETVQPFAPIYALILIPLFSPVLLVGMLACLLMPVPGIGQILGHGACLFAKCFLWIHDFAAAGAAPLWDLNKFAPFAAVSTLGVLLALIIGRKPVHYIFYVHALILAINWIFLIAGII